MGEMDECNECCVPGKMKHKSCCLSYEMPVIVLKGQLQGTGRYISGQTVQLFLNVLEPKHVEKITDGKYVLLVCRFVRK